MSVSERSRTVWSTKKVVRKKRSRKYGVIFFAELAFVAIMTSLCFIGFSLMAENEIAGAVAAVILAAAIMLSPLAERLIDGVLGAFRNDSENWDHYFND